MSGSGHRGQDGQNYEVAIYADELARKAGTAVRAGLEVYLADAARCLAAQTFFHRHLEMLAVAAEQQGPIGAVLGPAHELARLAEAHLAAVSEDGEALGVIETHTVAGIIAAADAAVKAATVTAAQIEMADGLGGKGYALFGGVVSEVEVAVEAGVAALEPAQLVAQVVIPQLHDEMREDVIESPYFYERIRDLGE